MNINDNKEDANNNTTTTTTTNNNSNKDCLKLEGWIT